MSETTEAAPPPADSPAAALPSLLDIADEAAAAPSAAAPAAAIRPEWCPEQFWDAERRELRAESLAKSWGDLRTTLAKGGMTPPDSPDTYRLPTIDGVPENLVGADDPLWRSVREAAHQAGISQVQLEQVARPYLRAMADARAAAAQPEDPAAIKAAYDAEVGRLGPQGRQVLAEVGTWLKGLVTRGVLSADEGRALGAWWSADQVRGLMRLRERMGESPIPLTALDDGQVTVADARRMLTDGHAKGDKQMVERARKALRDLDARGVNLLGTSRNL